jgi:hypothetical protein
MSIDFVKEVKERFDFLVREYDFRIISERQHATGWQESVIYVSPNVRIEVYHEVGPHTVGIYFRDLHHDDQQVWDFQTYLTLVDRSLARTFGYSIAQGDSEVLELLNMYKEALRSKGTEILRGEQKAFDKFREALKTGLGLEPIEGLTRFV